MRIDKTDKSLYKSAMGLTKNHIHRQKDLHLQKCLKICKLISAFYAVSGGGVGGTEGEERRFGVAN